MVSHAFLRSWNLWVRFVYSYSKIMQLEQNVYLIQYSHWSFFFELGCKLLHKCIMAVRLGVFDRTLCIIVYRWFEQLSFDLTEWYYQYQLTIICQYDVKHIITLRRFLTFRPTLFLVFEVFPIGLVAIQVIMTVSNSKLSLVYFLGVCFLLVFQLLPSIKLISSINGFWLPLWYLQTLLHPLYS
jgi:hypothetical protein